MASSKSPTPIRIKRGELSNAVEHGAVFGRLFVLVGGVKKGKTVCCLCQCECGESAVVSTHSLLRGISKSCGCNRTKAMQAARRKLGARSRDGASPELRKFYSSWIGMRARCADPKHKDFKYYGALGVKVCDRWQSFENFHEDMWPRPVGKTLDRKDPFGNYEPNNCRWATAKEQRHNRRKHDSA